MDTLLTEIQIADKYRSIFDNAVEGIYQSTPDGEILAVNPALAGLLGYDSPEELIASRIKMEEQYYVDPGTRTLFKRLLEEREIVYGLEYQAYRRDGSKIWVLENARTVRDEDGCLLYYEGSIEEITERKRDEAEREVIFEIIQGVTTTSNLDELLRLVHESLTKILHAENCIVALYDTATGYFNQPFYVDQFDTAAPPWKMGKSVTAYVFRTGRPLLMTLDIYQSLIEQGEVEALGTPSPSWLGVPLRTPTETIGVLIVQHYGKENAYSQRDVEFLSSVAGQIALAIERKRAEDSLRRAHDELERKVEERTQELSRANTSLMEQIAERRLFEEALQQNLNLLGAVIEGTNDAIFVKNLDGRYLLVNSAVAAMLDRPVEEIVGHTDAELFQPDIRAHILESDRQTVSLGRAWTYEDRGKTQDVTRTFLTTKAPYRDADRNVVGIIGISHEITERTRAEEALRESERKLRLIAENSTEVIYAYDMERRLLYVNPAVKYLTGYSVQELHERSFIPWVHEDDEERMLRLWEKLYEGEGFLDEEFRLITKDGQEKWCLASWGPLFDEEGRQIGVQGRECDITERKRMEAERQVLFEIMQGVSTTANLDELLHLIHRSISKVLYAENCFVSLYNKASGLFRKRFYVDQVSTNPSPHTAPKSCSAYVFRTGSPLLLTPRGLDELLERGEVELIGERSPSWLGVPLKTSTETIGVLVVQHYERENVYSQRDVEFLASVGSQVAVAIERKRAEEALAEANQRAIVEYERLLERIAHLGQTLGTARDLLTIFRSLRDFAIISAPCDSLIISLYDEKRCLRTNNYAWTDGQEVEVDDFKHVNVTGGRTSEALNTQKVVITHDFINYTKTAHHAFFDPVETNLVPDSAMLAPMSVMGKTIGLLEIQSYQVNAYRNEHAIAMNMAANLAAIAIENVRLFELEREKEEQLRQSQKMEAVGKLAGGVAHDFNNLLTAITGYSDLSLRRLEEGSPLRRNLEEIKKAGDRAAGLTQQLLAFSRKQMLQPKVLDLNAVIVDMFKLLQRLIGEDVDLLSVLHPTLGQVKADPGQLQQVVMNLGVNARDAMPQGGKLTIKTSNVYVDEDYARHHVSVTPGDYVLLSISDTGTGMDAGTQARIFEPFFTTKEQGKGTGLGLSTVYGIVKQSGGNIWVYSEVGKGTTFKIYLPRFDKPVESHKEEAAQDKPLAGTETILLVEDEEMVRDIAGQALEENGYRVLAARDTVHAQTICEEHEGEIHLMVTDVVMPQMSGRALAERVASLRPDMRVLYMSGYTDDHIVHHGVLEEGMHFLEKPFTADHLARKVREVLSAVVK